MGKEQTAQSLPFDQNYTYATTIAPLPPPAPPGGRWEDQHKSPRLTNCVRASRLCMPIRPDHCSLTHSIAAPGPISSRGQGVVQKDLPGTVSV